MHRERSPLQRFLLPGLLAATVLVIYTPLAQFPFVQDDWSVIHNCMFHPAENELADMINPEGKFFYRPLARFYCWLVYTAFGLHPAGFHILAILFLIVTSFLVVSVAGTLTRDHNVAWGSGFMYAAASNIHIDSQMWLVGIDDIGPGLLALLCVGSFIKKRYARSALWFALALGFKEGTAMLFFVLCAWTLLGGNDAPDKTPVYRKLFARLKWHSVAILALGAAKLTGVSLFALPLAHPYAARLIGSHIGINFQMFALFGLQAVLPLKSVVFTESEALMTLFITTAALALVFIAGVRHFGGPETGTQRPLIITLFVLGWFFLMLFPPLTLENHISRYYLTAALPPLVIGTMLLFKILVRNVTRSARILLIAIIVFTAANVIDGGLSVYRRVELGERDGVHTLGRDGDNHLIRKASIVRKTWKPLLAVLPIVPPRSLLVLENVETGCFADKYGVQVWYADSTLLLTDSPPTGPDSTGMVHATVAVEDPWNKPSAPPVISFPVSRTVHVRRTPDGLKLVRTEPPGG
jgi:hypothetical protein